MMEDALESHQTSSLNDFTWKAKIMLGFLQIISNIAVGLDVRALCLFLTFFFFFFEILRISLCDSW